MNSPQNFSSWNSPSSPSFEETQQAHSQARLYRLAEKHIFTNLKVTHFSDTGHLVDCMCETFPFTLSLSHFQSKNDPFFWHRTPGCMCDTSEQAHVLPLIRPTPPFSMKSFHNLTSFSRSQVVTLVRACPRIAWNLHNPTPGHTSSP